MILHRLPIGATVALALAACTPLPEGSPAIVESTTATAVTDEGDDPTVVAPDAATTPALGAREPLVVVTLFSDYQCPNCRRMNDLTQRLLDRWGDEVQVQFRQLPIPGHPLARVTALAALAAHRQSRFKCMSSALIRSRTSWTRLDRPGFMEFLATNLAPHCDLSHPQLLEDMGDPKLGAKIDADVRLARTAGVRGTPTILVDGFEARPWPRAGVPPANLLNAVVRRSLREARARLASCRAAGGTCRHVDLIADQIYGNTADSDVTMALLDVTPSRL